MCLRTSCYSCPNYSHPTCLPQTAKNDARAPLSGPRLPNSVCTVQVYQRVTSAGLRGTVTQTVVQRTHCGAATVAKLEPDFYALVAAYGTKRTRLLYPAKEDPEMAQSLRSLLDFGKGQLPERACADCHAVYLTARKKRDDSITDGGQHSMLGALASAAASAAQAVLGGLGGGAAAGAAAAHEDLPDDEPPLVGMATPVARNSSMSYQRRIQCERRGVESTPLYAENRAP